MGLEAFKFEPLKKLRASLHGQKNPTKVTVFTVAGTGQLDPTTGDANFPAQIAKRLNPDNWVWKAIYYPAAIPFTGSVLAGKASLAHAIRQTTGKFAIVSYSQGSMVASQIYNELMFGNLRYRNADMVASIAIGNPCRMAGSGWPGSYVVGHGIASADRRLATSDPRWLEFSAPGDLASAVVDDLTGQWLTTLFMACWGEGNLAAIQKAIQATLTAGAGALASAGQELLSYFGLGTGSPAAHTQYGTYQPLGGGRTCIDLAVEYLDYLGDSLKSDTDQEDTTT